MVCWQAGAFGGDEEAASGGEKFPGGGESLFVLEGFAAGVFVALYRDAEESAEKPFAERRGKKPCIGEEVYRPWYDGSGIEGVEQGGGVVGDEDAGAAPAEILFACDLGAAVVEAQGRFEDDFEEVICEVHEYFHAGKGKGF